MRSRAHVSASFPNVDSSTGHDTNHYLIKENSGRGRGEREEEWGGVERLVNETVNPIANERGNEDHISLLTAVIIPSCHLAAATSSFLLACLGLRPPPPADLRAKHYPTPPDTRRRHRRSAVRRPLAAAPTAIDRTVSCDVGARMLQPRQRRPFRARRLIPNRWNHFRAPEKRRESEKMEEWRRRETQRKWHK